MPFPIMAWQCYQTTVGFQHAPSLVGMCQNETCQVVPHSNFPCKGVGMLPNRVQQWGFSMRQLLVRKSSYKQRSAHMDLVDGAVLGHASTCFEFKDACLLRTAATGTSVARDNKPLAMIHDSRIPRDGLDQGPADRERPQRLRRSAAVVCPQQPLEVGFSLCNKEEGNTTEIQHWCRHLSTYATSQQVHASKLKMLCNILPALMLRHRLCVPLARCCYRCCCFCFFLHIKNRSGLC